VKSKFAIFFLAAALALVSRNEKASGGVFDLTTA